MTFKPVLARAAGFYDPDKASLDAALSFSDPSLTVQASADEADINTIVRRFGLTGEIPVTNRVAFPNDVSFDELLDYRTAWDRLIEAQRSFNSLPAQVRGNFAHDPMAFADYAADPANIEQLRSWGLAPPKAAEPPPPAPPPA